MSKLHFWIAIALAIILGLLGITIASFLPLPEPVTPLQTRLIYALVGILIGFLIFHRVASWIVKTVTRITRKVALRLAFEIMNQFTQLASKGLPWQARPQQIKSPNGNPLILDTSAIIDGRILDVAKTHFLSGLCLVPNFILTELQTVADSKDDLKRARGRYGFEIVEQLKKVNGIQTVVWDKEVSGKNADEKLVRLAKILGGKIITSDFNLNKLATLSGAVVLNINELANSLKTIAIPGEYFNLKIVQAGKDKHQGVGYLDDGTMVVVEGGEANIGNMVRIEVTRSIQIPAGRMIFGKKI